MDQMVVTTVKKRVRAEGSVKVLPGVWLETGEVVLDETRDYHEAMGTDVISEGYRVSDIITDEIYCVTDNGYFSCPTDAEIAEMLDSADEKE